jgi:hypothetical protein
MEAQEGTCGMPTLPQTPSSQSTKLEYKAETNIGEIFFRIKPPIV